jgi:hypothetical protein
MLRPHSNRTAITKLQLRYFKNRKSLWIFCFQKTAATVLFLLTHIFRHNVIQVYNFLVGGSLCKILAKYLHVQTMWRDTRRTHLLRLYALVAIKPWEVTLKKCYNHTTPWWAFHGCVAELFDNFDAAPARRWKNYVTLAQIPVFLMNLLCAI